MLQMRQNLSLSRLLLSFNGEMSSPPLWLLYVKMLDQTPISELRLCSFLLLSHLKQQAEHHTDQQVKRN